MTAFRNRPRLSNLPTPLLVKLAYLARYTDRPVLTDTLADTLTDRPGGQPGGQAPSTPSFGRDFPASAGYSPRQSKTPTKHGAPDGSI